MADNNNNNKTNNPLYFIEMGIREFAQEASNRLVDQFNLDYNDVQFLLDELIEEIIGGD